VPGIKQRKGQKRIGTSDSVIFSELRALLARRTPKSDRWIFRKMELTEGREDAGEALKRSVMKG